MPGLVPGIHVFENNKISKSWMALHAVFDGLCPAMSLRRSAAIP
jgi:hypothetical protein